MSAALSSSRHPVPIPHTAHLLHHPAIRALDTLGAIAELRWEQMQRDGIPFPVIPRKSQRRTTPRRTLD